IFVDVHGTVPSCCDWRSFATNLRWEYSDFFNVRAFLLFCDHSQKGVITNVAESAVSWFPLGKQSLSGLVGIGPIRNRRNAERLPLGWIDR
ncbi:MAG: hypothetical protein ACU0BJ_00165, partial [Shimia sp.]|uniref:hypothetical protein n=1 Tax=Shimia sp. TaxID=1954381 RepID=UPI00405A096B